MNTVENDCSSVKLLAEKQGIIAVGEILIFRICQIKLTERDGITHLKCELPYVQP